MDEKKKLKSQKILYLCTSLVLTLSRFTLHPSQYLPYPRLPAAVCTFTLIFLLPNLCCEFFVLTLSFLLKTKAINIYFSPKLETIIAVYNDKKMHFDLNEEKLSFQAQ